MNYDETIQKWLRGDLIIPDRLPKYRHDLRNQLHEEGDGPPASRSIN